MATDDDVPADAPPDDRIGRTGARFRPRSSDDGPRPPSASGRFETALRGYSRRDVDAHLAQLEDRIRVLEDAVRHSDQRRLAVESHAALLEAELSAARADRPQRPVEQLEQGSVADGLLRQARREAARVRVEAADAARRLLEDAQAEAARTRDRAERAAADWTARVEQHLTRRLAEVEAERLPDSPGS
jgi:DivIVA domain-containing protein